MNNGRPNYGNQPGWGKQPSTNQQQGGYTGAQQPYPGYPPQGQGYQQPGYQQPGYPPQQRYQPQPGYQQQTGYQPYPQGYPPQQTGYQQPGGYQQTQNPYGYNRQPAGGYQQYPPQGQQPYPPGYPGYQQGGYGGYQQPAQPPKKHGVRLDTIMMILLCGVLPVLFVLGLVFSGMPALKWVFVGLSVVSVLILWIKPVVASNVRLTFSGVYAALAVVALVSALTGTAPADNTVSGSPAAAAGQSAAGQTSADAGNSGDDGGLAGWVTEVPSPTPTEAPNELEGETVEQLKSFFYFWSVNNQTNMLTLCAPSWQRSVENPTTALFSILANRIPLDYTPEKISGTENDTARTVTLVATIDKRNGRDPEKYRFQVLMLKEDGIWYVDPSSLQTNESAATDSPETNITATPPPTPAPASSSTVLYYNPDGGSYYHLDQNCSKVGSKYLPLAGSFTFDELNDPEYQDLIACPYCAAPKRPT